VTLTRLSRPPREVAHSLQSWSRNVTSALARRSGVDGLHPPQGRACRCWEAYIRCPQWMVETTHSLECTLVHCRRTAGMKKETRCSARHDTLTPRTRPHFSARTRGNSRPVPHVCFRRGTRRRRTNIFPMLLSWQSLKTKGGFVLIAFSIFAAGSCQL